MPPLTITRHPAFRFIASFALCFCAGYVNLSCYLPALTGWFVTLKKPAILPSVTLIYYGIIVMSLLLGSALYIIWNAAQKRPEARLTGWVFLLGLFLNVAWFGVFFWAQSVFFGLMVLLILLMLTMATIYLAFRSAVLAVLFLIPYAIFLFIALYANLFIFVMNPNLPFGTLPAINLPI